MQRAALAHVLEGRDPKDDADWCNVVAFWAANVKGGMEVATCQIMAMLYKCPLTKEIVERVATEQVQASKGRE